MSKVFISLGTNLGEKKRNLNQALAFIQSEIGNIEQKSSIYETEPWGYDSFNNFLNQVIGVRTALTAREVMDLLLEIEHRMGRRRYKSKSYTDRLIDLDILFYNDEIIDKNDLHIPHPKLHTREFVLQPLVEVSDQIIHPSFNKTVLQLLAELKR